MAKSRQSDAAGWSIDLQILCLKTGQTPNRPRLKSLELALVFAICYRPRQLSSWPC